MTAVWKFPLQPGRQTIDMPADALVLTVDAQYLANEWSAAVWALVEPDATQTESRCFVVVATGEAFDDSGLVYVGSVLILGGVLVFHVFMEVTGE